MLSRREMGALCAALLLCFLLSLGAGWAKGQLDAADALAADTLRLHIRADTNAVRDQSAKLAVRDAVLALADESCPADGKADAKVWAASNLVRLELTAREVLAARAHPRTGARLPRQYVFPHPALRRSGPARRTVRCSAAGHRDSPAGPQLVVCALPGPLPVGLRRVCTARRKRPRLRGVPRAIPAGGVVGRSHRPPGGCSAGRGNALPRRRIG